MSNYQHIKTLVSDLHTAKNHAHPEQLLLNSPDANNPKKSLLMKMHPCQSPVSNSHHKLMVHQLSSVHPPPPLCMIVDDEDRANDRNINTTTNSVTLRLPSICGNTKTSKGIANDVNCTSIVPTVMLNDVHEPLDLISTTQRRFSQLYLGLRRFSTSNTVGSRSSEL